MNENRRNKNPSYDYMSDTIPTEEYVNIALLDYALENSGSLDISPVDVAGMKKIKRRANKESGRYEPIYEQKGATLNGRVYCKTGLCALSSRWRNALAYNTYEDCDMINASYTIALQLARKYDLPTTKLEDYVKNRPKVMLNYIVAMKKKDKVVDKALAKEHFIKKLFSTKPNVIVKGSLDHEIKMLQERVMLEEPKVVKAVEHEMKKKSENYNKRGKVLSHIIFNEENRILNLAIKYMKKDGYKIGGSMMDGFFIQKKKEGCELLLNNLNKYLKEVEELDIVFTLKPMIKFPLKLDSQYLNLSREETMREEKNRYEELKEIFENTEDVAKIKLQNGFLILRESGNTFISTSALKEIYIDWSQAGSFRTSQITATKAPKLFIENWILDPNKRIYENQRFVPSLNPDDCPKKYFNTFKGYAVEIASNSNPEFSEEDTNDYLALKSYLKNLFADKKGKEQSRINYKYFMKWIAYKFQYPTDKNEIMIVLKGKKGIGKSDLVLMMGRMFGEEYVFETRDPAREVWGGFNGALEDKVLVNIDEPEGIDNEKNIEKMKGAITSKTMNIRKLYKNIEVQKNYISFIMTLNEENTGIRITDDNRRFALFESATKRYTEDQYMKFYRAQRNMNALVLLYRDLMNIDLSDFNFDRTTIPKTDFLERSMRNSVKNYHSFLEQLLLDNHTRSYSNIQKRLTNENYIVLCGDLYKGYTRYCDNIGDTDYMSKVKNIDFKKEMRAIDGIEDRHTSHKPSGINGQCYIVNPTTLKNSLIELGLNVDTTPEADVGFLSDSSEDTGALDV